MINVSTNALPSVHANSTQDVGVSLFQQANFSHRSH
jgi:hypothetical protein